MAWVQIAKTETITYSVGAQTFTYTVKLEQDGGTLDTTTELRLIDRADVFKGDENAEALASILAGRMEFGIYDDNRHFASLFEVGEVVGFRVTATRNGDTWFKGPLYEVRGGDRVLQANQPLDLVFSDGIHTLKDIAWDKSGYMTIAELFGWIMAQTPTELPTWVYIGLSHVDADPLQNPAVTHRLLAEDIVLDNEQPSYYDVLLKLCELVNAQVVQSAGAWRVMQRSARSAATLDGVQIAIDGTTITDISTSVALTLTDGIADGGNSYFEKRQKPPVSGLLSAYDYSATQEPFHDGDFTGDFLDDGGFTQWDGWTKAGTVTAGSFFSGKPKIDDVNYVAAKLTQSPGIPVSQGDVVTLAIDAYALANAAFSGYVKLGVVTLEYADGTTYYANVALNQNAAGDQYPDATGSWDLSSSTVRAQVNLTGAADDQHISSDMGVLTQVPVVVTMEPVPSGDGGPAVVTVEVSTNCSPGGSTEIDKVEWNRFNLGVEYDGDLATRTLYSIGTVAQETRRKTFTIGDRTLGNPSGSLLQYYDGTSWVDAEDWDGLGGSFHGARLTDAFKQVVSRLDGLDVTLALVESEDVQMHHTMTYGGTKYIPVYSEESTYPLKRRLVVYPLRSDAVPSVSETLDFGGGGVVTNGTGSGGGGGTGGGVTSFNGRSGAVTLASLDVTKALGYTPLEEALQTGDDATLNSLDITAGLTVGGALGVTGAATLGNTLAVTGATTLNSTLHAVGQATFDLTPKVGLNTIWHAGNDGSGSGLDADLLDGKNSGNASGNIPISNGALNAGLVADKLDGYDALAFPRKAENAAITGAWNFDTDSGAVPLRISRAGGATEALKIWVDDRNAIFDYEEDAGEPGGPASMRFRTSIDDGASVEMFTIDGSNGFVGVKNTTPTYGLDVGGTFRATGAATLSSTLSVGGAATLSSTLAVSGATTLSSTLHTVGVGTFDTHATFAANVGTPSFQSQTTGWQVNNLGAADFRSIYADSLFVKAFTADVAQALVGSEIITKSRAKLSRSFTVPAQVGDTSTLYVQDLEELGAVQVFTSGDLIRLRYISQAGGGLVVGDAWGIVTGYSRLNDAAGEQHWTFTLKKASAGVAGKVINKGALALDYGASGDGIIESTVLDQQGSPYTQTKTWTAGADGTPASYTVLTRTGKLTGITDALWGTLSGAGLYATNAYLDGKMVAREGYVGTPEQGWTITSTYLQNANVLIGNDIDAHNAAKGLYVGNWRDGEVPIVKVNGTTTNQYVALWSDTNASFLGADTWGIIGRDGSNVFFRLGDTNQIAGANFDFESVWAGGAKGSAGWQWNEDGSGYAAQGKFSWDLDSANLFGWTADATSLKNTVADGQGDGYQSQIMASALSTDVFLGVRGVTAGAPTDPYTFYVRNDGYLYNSVGGSLAGGNLTWDAAGNVTSEGVFTSKAGSDFAGWISAATTFGKEVSGTGIELDSGNLRMRIYTPAKQMLFGDFNATIELASQLGTLAGSASVVASNIEKSAETTEELVNLPGGTTGTLVIHYHAADSAGVADFHVTVFFYNGAIIITEADSTTFDQAAPGPDTSGPGTDVTVAVRMPYENATKIGIVGHVHTATTVSGSGFVAQIDMQDVYFVPDVTDAVSPNGMALTSDNNRRILLRRDDGYAEFGGLRLSANMGVDAWEFRPGEDGSLTLYKNGVQKDSWT